MSRASNLAGFTTSISPPTNLSVGIITASSVINVGTGLTLSSGGINITGVITATSFSGNGSGLTGAGIGTTGSVNTSGIITATSIVVSAGTTALPSISPTGDSNTGIFFPSADTIAFSEGGAEAMRVDSSGRLLIGISTSGNANGGILQLTSGITFPATAVAATDVNTLDDYEEGTWTPVIADDPTGGNAGTATVAQSSYTRIGNIVTIQMYIYNLNTTGMTGANRLYIRGFPFVAAKRSIGAFYTYRVARDAGTVSSSSMIAHGSSSIYFHVFTTNGAEGDKFILVSDIVGGPSEIMFTNTYQV